MVGASFLSSEKIIEKRGPILAAFARATAKALAYTIANVEDAYLLSEKYIGKQTPEKQSFFKAVLTETCELFRTDGAYGSMDVAQYQASVEDLVRLGLIPKSYDAKILIRNLR
jgi:ABC-type nitrate/sulfonate/bicarbonate transport system substrate-binding protein